MKNTSSFVCIKTLYTGSSDRTIECLKTKYGEIPELIGFIKPLIYKNLPENSIVGKKIFIKPNWVMHSKTEIEKLCLTTHENFILATLEIVLQENPREIIIGNSPIQGCDWIRLLSKDFLDNVNILKRKYNTPVQIVDLRRTTFNPSQNNLESVKKPISDYVIFNLGKKSYLEPITIEGESLFRVSDYNSVILAESHKPGVHKYCITKALFECDLIISLPKVKTHNKAGLTNALKNIVGLNGDKDYLPHHRLGGTKRGGDCYPGEKILLHWAELILDSANRKRGKFLYRFLRLFAYRLWRLSFPSRNQNLGAAWYGNDTVWRMVMDLNLIVEFGLQDGTLSNYSQRVLYSLSDGIIGGQGEGPLKPEPLPLGIICFSNNSYFSDLAMSYLMGFDYKKIPLLKAAWKNKKDDLVNVFINDEKIELTALHNHSIITKAPLGWADFI